MTERRFLARHTPALCVAFAAAAWSGNMLYSIGEPGSALKYWSPSLVAGAMIAFLIVHGRSCYDGRAVFVFVVNIFLIGWTFETISVLTGFPFGNYHYTEIMGPFIGHVPISVMPAYCVMGYASWSMARILLKRFDQSIDGTDRFFTPIVAAALMVLWDLSMDPLRATVEGRWIWIGGGPHYGVPIMNFAGWFGVTWLMFQCFAMWLGRSRAEANPQACSRVFWLAVPLMYAAFAGEYIVNPFVGENASAVVRVNGAPMPIVAIYQDIAVLTAATIVPAAVVAALRISQYFSAGAYSGDVEPAVAEDTQDDRTEWIAVRLRHHHSLAAQGGSGGADEHRA